MSHHGVITTNLVKQTISYKKGLGRWLVLNLRKFGGYNTIVDSDYKASQFCDFGRLR